MLEKNVDLSSKKCGYLQTLLLLIWSTANVSGLKNSLIIRICVSFSEIYSIGRGSLMIMFSIGIC